MHSSKDAKRSIELSQTIFFVFILSQTCHNNSFFGKKKKTTKTRCTTVFDLNLRTDRGNGIENV